jgi:hypothetical protein
LEEVAKRTESDENGQNEIISESERYHENKLKSSVI